jgi:hypothetical protein
MTHEEAQPAILPAERTHGGAARPALGRQAEDMLAAVEAYWWAIKPADGLPGRRHVDPLDLPRALPWLFLIDVVPQSDGGRRYRFRLIGTGLVEKFQRDSTGRFVDELYGGDDLDRMNAGFGEAIHARRPLTAERQMPVAGREFLRFRRLLCPLANDGQSVDMLMGAHAYY